eukprot:4620845-Amphidinium_carterae.1
MALAVNIFARKTGREQCKYLQIEVPDNMVKTLVRRAMREGKHPLGQHRDSRFKLFYMLHPPNQEQEGCSLSRTMSPKFKGSVFSHGWEQGDWPDRVFHEALCHVPTPPPQSQWR